MAGGEGKQLEEAMDDLTVVWDKLEEDSGKCGHRL